MQSTEFLQNAKSSVSEGITYVYESGKLEVDLNTPACLCLVYVRCDRLCGLVVRVSGYRYRGPGFDPRRYQIF